MNALMLVAESVAGACYQVPADAISKNLSAYKATRKRRLVAARQLAIYLSADSFGVQHDDIAARYKLHRTLVSKVLSKINRARGRNEELDDQLDLIAEGLTALKKNHLTFPELLEAALGKPDDEET